MKTKTRINYTLTPSIIKAAILPADYYRAVLLEAPSWRREAGWVSGGLCPFHSDKRAGSFRINLDTGAFSCFSCGARGKDIIDFVRRLDGLSFRDALTKLAREWEE